MGGLSWGWLRSPGTIRDAMMSSLTDGRVGGGAETSVGSVTLVRGWGGKVGECGGK